MISSIENAKSIKDLQTLNFNFVIYAREEENGYHDSDFLVHSINLDTNELITEVAWSTRHAGHKDLSQYADLTLLDRELQIFILAEVRKQCEIKAEKFINETNHFVVGAEVIVSNPKARKMKGEIFRITKVVEHKYKNQSQGDFAYNDKGEFTNIKNLEVINYPNNYKTFVTNCFFNSTKPNKIDILFN